MKQVYLTLNLISVKDKNIGKTCKALQLFTETSKTTILTMTFDVCFLFFLMILYVSRKTDWIKDSGARLRI